MNKRLLEIWFKKIRIFRRKREKGENKKNVKEKNNGREGNDKK